MKAPIVTLNSNVDAQDLIIARPAAGLSLQGRIQVPGDKSISHRALMLGSIARGETRISGLLLGEDPRSTANCFRALGAEISPLNTEKVQVVGIGLGECSEPTDVLDCGNSGTTMRLMLGILASHPGRFFTVTGDKSLRARPMSRVVQPLGQMGAQVWGRKQASLAPLAIQGTQLQPIHYHSPVASAQVKSCILLAGLMTAGETTVTEPALSRDHSERMLQAFGASVSIDPETNSVTVTGPAQLQGQSVIVPGDISSAAFWLVAGACVPGSELIIENVGVNPTRTGVLEALEMMGADITQENQRVVAGEPVADLRVKSGPLQGWEIAGPIIPRLIDEIPILAVAAVFAEGKTIIKDAAELRVKESDRIAVMARQLNRLGARVTELPDGLEIIGGTPLTGTDVQSESDHRIAMSLAIAALNATGTTTISGASAAAISYPDFTATLQQVLCI
ncbi:MAG: 3-phosphoshikimate 1-carboxyvinyltransferase [Hormoscilla sp. GUM202]|nr:3-phosphoshikimate 1-carboxyvinyltransferase [Hormoscilla sp. GUM202]